MYQVQRSYSPWLLLAVRGNDLDYALICVRLCVYSVTLGNGVAKRLEP